MKSDQSLGRGLVHLSIRPILTNQIDALLTDCWNAALLESQKANMFAFRPVPNIRYQVFQKSGPFQISGIRFSKKWKQNFSECPH